LKQRTAVLQEPSTDGESFSPPIGRSYEKPWAQKKPQVLHAAASV